MSNWEKTMKEWDDSIPDGIKYLSAEKQVLMRRVRELESENAALQARAERAENLVEWLIELCDVINGDKDSGWNLQAVKERWTIEVAKWKERE